jgi:hypothetical protein
MLSYSRRIFTGLKEEAHFGLKDPGSNFKDELGQKSAYSPGASITLMANKSLSRREATTRKYLFVDVE